MTGATTRKTRTAQSEQMRAGLAGLRQARSEADEAPKPQRLLGRTESRLFPEPLRPLTRKTTRGYELIDFADQVLGEPFDPWQEWLAIHALELNPDGSYRFRTVLVLVARQNGKTHFLRVLTLWRMYMDGIRLVLGCAQDLSVAREVWQECIDTIKTVSELKGELAKESHKNGDEWFKLSGGAKYAITAANRSAGRGKSVDLMNMDEIREQRNWAAWSALSKTTMARAFAQIWAISNAGDDESVVLNHLRDAAESGADETIGLFEWSAPEGCELDDREAWAQANPGMGYNGPSEQAIKSAMGTDPPTVFRTEVLCQNVPSLDAAVDGGAWAACQDNAGSLETVRERVIAVIDVAPDGRHVTLAGAAELGNGRCRVELFEAWESTEAARRELPALLERIKPAAIGWFPSGPAAALGADLRGIQAKLAKVGVKLKHDTIELTGQEVNETCQEFADLVLARRIVHPGDPLLNAHVAGSQKLRVGEGWRFCRRGVGHVDAAYAAAGAVHIARTLPVEVHKPRSSVV